MIVFLVPFDRGRFGIHGKNHIVIDFLVTYLPPKYLKILNFPQKFLILVILITLIVTGIQITSLYADQNAASIEISNEAGLVRIIF